MVTYFKINWVVATDKFAIKESFDFTKYAYSWSYESANSSDGYNLFLTS